MSGTVTRRSAASLMAQGQDNFLRQGGTFVGALAKMREEGQIENGIWHEYPKDIRLHRGTETVKCSTETARGKDIEWEETRNIIETITVHSEEEEERVLNGGKTAEQIEGERLDLLELAKSRGLRYDPSWSKLRLEKELGLFTGGDDASAAFDEVAQLEQQVAKAKHALELRKQLATLQAELDAAPAVQADDTDGMRAELESLGVKVDGRWSAARMRQELDRATAPGAAA